MRSAVLLLLMVFQTGRVSAQVITADRLFAQAANAVVNARFSEAIELYSRAGVLARESGNVELALNAILLTAEANEAWALKEPSESARFLDAINLYREVIGSGNESQKLLARNNLGAILFRQERYLEAVGEFDQIDYEKLMPAGRAAFRFNQARASELSGNTDRAFLHYVEAIEARPDFVAPADAAARLIRTNGPNSSSVGKLERFVGVLLAHGQIASAGRHIKSFLGVWASTPLGEPLLSLLLQYYTAGSIDSKRFDAPGGALDGSKESEWQYLTDLSNKNSVLRPLTQGIGRAYLCQDKCGENGQITPFSQMYTRTEVHQFFPGWGATPQRASAFSRMLKVQGDSFTSNGDYRNALVRYSSAWLIDPDNSEAALHTAAILNQHGREYDRDNKLRNLLSETYTSGNVFERFLEAFTKNDSDKNRLERRPVTSSDVSSKDASNIMHMYLLLGTAEGGRVEELQRALRAEQRVKPAGQADVAPGLHLELARAYKRVGNFGSADREYRVALDAFTKEGNVQQVRVIQSELQSLPKTKQ